MSLFLQLGCLFALVAQPTAAPIHLHPDNPHYFEWRGRPTILSASGEHYGAVLNLDFDYGRYLDELMAGDSSWPAEQFTITWTFRSRPNTRTAPRCHSR